jgi:ribonucleotide monophosphatase NagD (HAD superfamily)
MPCVRSCVQVANPDVVTVHASELRTMPGTLARWYAEEGGQVLLMGKPADIIYKAALSMLGDLAPGSVLAIGDSMEHDIAGARAAGVDALFVGGGIHAQALGIGAVSGEAGSLIAADPLHQLCCDYGVAPDFAVPFFVAS